MKFFFRKLFGIYPGEGKKTLRFAFLVITWSLGATCISTLTDGLFIEKLGEEYFPKVYLTAAISMIIGSSLILWLLKNFSPYKILMGVLLIGVAITTTTSFVIYYGPPLWFWFAIKAFSLTYIANIIACSWALIDNYHDLQDAKRTYSMYNASYFLGVVISGLLISNFLEKLSLTILFLISASFLLAAVFLVKKIVNKDSAVHDETVEGVFSGDRKNMLYIIKQIFSHPFVFSLLCLSLIIQLIGTTTEYSYLSSISNFLGDQDGKVITKYLGNTRSIISAFNIIVGIFFYNRFVRLVGLRNIILLPAFAFFILFGKWLSCDSLMMVILGIISWDGISYTIEDNNYNQLVNAVPSKLKAKVRIINDSFFEPLGMLISSSLLLILDSKILGFILAIIMIIFSFVIRAIYHKYVYINLKENAVHFEKKPFQWLSPKAKDEKQKNIYDLLNGLKNNSSDICLLAIEGLLILKDERFLERIILRANKFQTSGKLKFLELIECSIFSEHSKIKNTLKNWVNQSKDTRLITKCKIGLVQNKINQVDASNLNSPNSLTKCLAIFSILDNSSLSSDLTQKACNKIQEQISFGDLEEKILALEILSKLKNNFSFTIALNMLVNINDLKLLKKASKIIALSANYTHSKYSHLILEALKKHSNSYIRSHCLLAIEKIQNVDLIYKLIELSLHFRPSEKRSVENAIISMGSKAIPILLPMLKDTTLHDKLRILVAKTIARIDLKILRKCFKSIILIEIERAYFYSFNAKSIQKDYKNNDLSILVEVLKTGFHSSIEFIVHLLAAVGSIEDCELIVRSLKSKNAKIHSHAIESLENACERSVFKWIAPLVDNLPWTVFIDSYTNLIGKTPSTQLSAILEQLNKSPSISNKLIVANFNILMPLNNNQKKVSDVKKLTSNNHIYETART